MNFTYWLIIYFHATGSIMHLADYGPDKPDCDKMAASYNTHQDTSVQTAVCVPIAKPAVPEPSKPVTRKAAPELSPDYVRGLTDGIVAGQVIGAPK